jgi:hypothetical protein
VLVDSSDEATARRLSAAVENPRPGAGE